jgi:uridine kinase
MKRPMLILVAGGSASGKSTVVREILAASNIDDVAIITHDDYYKDNSNMSFVEREKINYDHPSSFDNNLLLEQLTKLLNYETINKPIYDFVIHNRSKEYETITPKQVIILEGILVLEDERIRALSNLNIFVELDDDTRFIRRLLRDMKERGRTMESVIKQYQETVKPMYNDFIRPTKRYADVIIPNDIKHDMAVDLLVAKIQAMRGDNKK